MLTILESLTGPNLPDLPLRGYSPVTLEEAQKLAETANVWYLTTTQTAYVQEVKHENN